MINLETLVRSPYSKEEETPPTPMTGEQFAKRSRETVQRVVDYINKRVRFLGVYYPQDLLRIEGGKEKIEVAGYADDTTYEISTESAQEALFGVMQEYGIDKPNNDMLSVLPGYVPDSLREFQYYPSNKVRGLYFVRERQYFQDSGQTFEVNWKVDPKVSSIKFPPF